MPSPSVIKGSNARQELHTRKPCVAPSGTAPAGKHEDRGTAPWLRGSMSPGKHDNMRARTAKQ